MQQPRHQVRNQLSDRNLADIAASRKLPYNIRAFAQKILDDRRRQASYQEAMK